MEDNNKQNRAKERLGHALNGNLANTVLLTFIKYFCWIILALSVMAIVVAVFIESFDIDLSAKNTTLLACLLAVCIIANHFSFQASGISGGRDVAEYKTNATQYKQCRSYRREKDICDFIEECKKRDREDFILYVCQKVSKTEDEIRAQSLKDIKRNKNYSRLQRKLMRRLILCQYPNTAPKSSAMVLNIIADNAKTRYGMDANKKKRYLAQKNVSKVITTIPSVAFMAALAVQFFQSVNWAEAVIKLILALLSIVMSICGGYMSGFKATAIIEKDTLFSACQFFSDMDIWLKEQGRKTRYTPDEFTSKESTTDNHN